MAHRKHTTKARPARPAPQPTRRGRQVIHHPETKDFALYLDGELCGFARTYQEGETTLDGLVFERLSRAA